MCSDKQRVANQINAKRSTGPRTAGGKAIVSQNSVMHGLRAATVATPRASRRRRALVDFTAALRQELAPSGMLQNIVFNQITTLGWKLLRIKRIEGAILRADRQQRLDEQRREEMRFGEIAIPMKAGALTEAQLIAAWFRAGIAEGRNAHVTLRRYESEIERAFYRACAELKKLQAESRDAGEPLEGLALAEQSQFSDGAMDSIERPSQHLGLEPAKC
jgi:hypothetical protein